MIGSMRLGRFAAPPLAILALLAVGCAQGEAAIAKMDEEQQAYVTTLERIEAGMSEDEVARLLGAPMKGAGTARPCWETPGAGEGQACVYFFPGRGAARIRWINMFPNFTWERDLL
ncbi:MAG: hypothetical protein ABFS34_11405 [Gemmatimonadota bacterium]